MIALLLSAATAATPSAAAGEAIEASRTAQLVSIFLDGCLDEKFVAPGNSEAVPPARYERRRGATRTVDVRLTGLDAKFTRFTNKPGFAETMTSSCVVSGSTMKLRTLWELVTARFTGARTLPFPNDRMMYAIDNPVDGYLLNFSRGALTLSRYKPEGAARAIAGNRGRDIVIRSLEQPLASWELTFVIPQRIH